MGMHPGIREFIGRLAEGKITRIVGFGSSNTEARAECRFNWLDWFDMGLHSCYGRFHRTINSGISGNTTGQMLERFSEDVALYEPHLVFVTGGGNDSAPEKTKGAEVFRANLDEIVRRIGELGATTVLQTYYSVDLERMEPAYADAWPRYMEVIREVSIERGVPIFDHYSRWERLRRSDVDLYRSLMKDPLHVNPGGNMLMGVDLLRFFGVSLGEDARRMLADGLRLQEKLDSLAGQSPGS